MTQVNVGMDPRQQPGRRVLSCYPFIHDVRPRFGDLDSLYGHLNNVAIATFYDDARELLNRTMFGSLTLVTSHFYFVVVQLSIHYLAEVGYPGEYRVGVGVSRIGTSSMVHSLGLFQGKTCVGLCDTVMVHMTGNEVTPLSAEQRAILETMSFPAGQRAEKSGFRTRAGLLPGDGADGRRSGA
ncbi:hypothetical protein FDG2_6445 [Candidatus Protofrankia californiensis]|uniref:Uncharacterized protein n=1 Tax=Candidatus Protofrankia californiensis TaxID=1839754 RepID=A0A1C3PH66_9ACTN|nr:hypothetical protein FDG2_6445 [Candidatus Protofrankia californiensis]